MRIYLEFNINIYYSWVYPEDIPMIFKKHMISP